MNKFIVFFILYLMLNSVSCANNEAVDSEESVKGNSVILTEKSPEVIDEIIIVNECKSSQFEAVLRENINAYSNAHELNVSYNDQRKSFSRTFDLPHMRAKLVGCNEDYIIIGFACGGPCYAETFVAMADNKPIETFGYCDRTLFDLDIITYIDDEKFEEKKILNIKSGEEKSVNISECVEIGGFPCIADTIYVNNKDTLVLEYELPREERIVYKVSIKELMKK